MSGKNKTGLSSGIYKSNKFVAALILIVAIILIFLVGLAIYLIFFMHKSAPSYIYSNSISINKTNSNLYKNLTISSNTLVVLNESSATMSIFVKNGATLYLNLSGNSDTINVFGNYNEWYVLKLLGNQNNIYTYNMTQIALSISGVSDSLYTNSNRICDYTFYQYMLPGRIKIISSAC